MVVGDCWRQWSHRVRRSFIGAKIDVLHELNQLKKHAWSLPRVGTVGHEYKTDEGQMHPDSKYYLCHLVSCSQHLPPHSLLCRANTGGEKGSNLNIRPPHRSTKQSFSSRIYVLVVVYAFTWGASGSF